MSGLIHNAIFSAREGAGWTSLGRVIDPSIATDPAAILAALGTYDVRKYTAGYQTPDGAWHAVPERAALVGVWDTEENAKGIKGADGANIRTDGNSAFFEFASEARYHLDYRQPLHIVQSFEQELKENRLEISHAASLKGGRIITVCARVQDLEAASRITGDSETQVYICAASGYDKKQGTEYWVTIVRMVCDNTRRAGMSEAEGKGRLFRATAAMKLNASSLKVLMSQALDIVKADAVLMNELATYKLSSAQAREYFATLLDIDTGKLDSNERNADGRPVISTRSRNQLLALQSAYVRGPGSQLVAADGTLFGAVQAVTYIVDHESQIRDTMREGNQNARMASATFGNGAAMKARAVQVATQLLQPVAA